VGRLVAGGKNDPNCTKEEAEALDKWYADTLRDYLQAQIMVGLCTRLGVGPTDPLPKDERSFDAAKAATLEALRSLEENA